MLVLVPMVPMLALWLVMARRPRSRWTVSAVLAGLTAAAILLGYLLPRASVEITLGTPLAAALIIMAARLSDRRRWGRSTQTRLLAPAALLAVWLVISWFVVLVVSVPTPFYPAADTVLPAPDGMQAGVAPHDPEACGSLSCQLTITVTGRPGQPADALEAELTSHLRSRGWGHGCRPVGWLLDGSTECVELSVTGNRATIHLLGNRENVRERTI